MEKIRVAAEYVDKYLLDGLLYVYINVYIFGVEFNYFTQNTSKMSTELTNTTQTARLAAIEQFKSYIFGIPIDSLYKYEFGFTHDGFYFFNPHCNSFTQREIEVFDGFCNMYKYSFSIFGRKWDNVSGYGSLGCEIQCF